MESGDAFSCTNECEPSTGPVGCRQLQTGQPMKGGCQLGVDLDRLRTLHTRILLGQDRDGRIAEEAPARAMMKVLGVTDPIEHLPAFFAKIVYRERIDLIRRAQRTQRFAPKLTDPDRHDGEIVDRLDYEAHLSALLALDGVSELGVQLAVLRWVFGWKTEELMDHFGMSRAAIDKQISRVRQAAERQRRRFLGP